jgi:ubiquinone/menaquinone biosynthesis C-methylase UbiE
MTGHFQELFCKTPTEIIDGDYFYNADSEGDQYDETDVGFWLSEDGCNKRWEIATPGSQDEMFAAFLPDVLNAFRRNPSPFLEIACGPGMGHTPAILSEYPQIPCLASDACSLLIKSWRKYINGNLNGYDINLASFNVMDMPLKTASFDVVTSFIGVSSTRAGEQGKMQALKEVFRVLKNGGYFIAVENDWLDYDAIERVFSLWGQPVWASMKNEKPWRQLITDAGFIIEDCDKTFIRYLREDDNDLGEQAHKFGINIGLKFTLFVLRKPD